MDETNKLSDNLWMIVGILLFGTLAIAGYKLKSSMAPDIIATAELDKSCNLRQGACSSKFSDGSKVTFSITPNDIPILRPLELTIKIEGINASKVAIDFIGDDMDMGYNRPVLEKIDSTHFKGKAIIPVCVHAKMGWKANVLLSTDNGLIMAPFRFYTIK